MDCDGPWKLYSPKENYLLLSIAQMVELACIICRLLPWKTTSNMHLVHLTDSQAGVHGMTVWNQVSVSVVANTVSQLHRCTPPVCALGHGRESL